MKHTSPLRTFGRCHRRTVTDTAILAAAVLGVIAVTAVVDWVAGLDWWRVISGAALVAVGAALGSLWWVCKGLEHDDDLPVSTPQRPDEFEEEAA